jgi:hypothetical protein
LQRAYNTSKESYRLCTEIITELKRRPGPSKGCRTIGRKNFHLYLKRVFQNRVLRRIFGPKRDEEMGDWTKLHNEELHNLYSSPNTIIIIMISKKDETDRVKRNAYRILVGKPGGKRPLERPRRK